VESVRNLTADILEVVTIGFPFCAFKVVVGLLLVREGAGFAEVAGALLIGLGALDALFNVVNLASLLGVRRRVVSACTFSALTRRLTLFRASPSDHMEDLGNSIDVLLSFSLVAAMVGLGKIAALPAEQLRAWNGAVVLNVLGAGLGRVGASLRRIA
jgi:hypothetical protein